MNTQLNVKSVFRDVYGDSTNFITPYVIAYGQKKQAENLYLLWELSTGTDFERNPIFGVTVLECKNQGFSPEKRPDLSRGGFTSEESAREYIQTLKLRLFRK